MAQDSPLSIAASVTGILTFVGAVLAGFYARAISLGNAIDTQAEVSSVLEKIEFLEIETDMLNNSYLASQIRHPNRQYGKGDFNYFQGLYSQSLNRMRNMDRELRATVASVTDGNRYDRMSRVKNAAGWMTARDRIHRGIEERKAESNRIFQIQLAMLSAKIDELSYHQNHHNSTCSLVVEELEGLQHVIQSNTFQMNAESRPALAAATILDEKHPLTAVLAMGVSPRSTRPSTPCSVSILQRNTISDPAICS